MGHILSEEDKKLVRQVHRERRRRREEAKRQSPEPAAPQGRPRESRRADRFSWGPDDLQVVSVPEAWESTIEAFVDGRADAPPAGEPERELGSVMPDYGRGALLGLAIGDALGTTNEFRRMDAPRFPKLAEGPLRGIEGRGPFHLQPGQITDDTQMAVCLSDSLVQHRGLDVNDVARRYVAWTEHAFDVGGQTGAALRLVRSGLPPREAGRQVWRERGKQAAGNGSLMRTAPIGVLIDDAVERRRASLEESGITHYDPRCQLACAVFNAAISAGIRGCSKERMWREAMAELPRAASMLDAEPGIHVEVDGAVEVLVRDLIMAQQADPELYGPELHLQQQEGFVRVAFRLAFWHLLHTGSFAKAVLDAANRGGDADTNAAIVGALVGARDGDTSWPMDWEAQVLGALRESQDPLATLYHPRRFQDAVETLWDRP